jgi:nucleoside-diphosphate-sugar epimerase
MEPVMLRRTETDLRDASAVFDTVRRARPEIIFHCAVSRGHPKTSEQRLESLASSVMGTAYLAEAAAEAGVERFIHVGSSLVYGQHDREFRESDCMRPPSFARRRQGVRGPVAAAVQRVHRFPGRGIAAVLGIRPLGRSAPLIPTLLRAAMTGEPIPLVKGPRHDFIFVEDVVDACLCATRVATVAGAVFNIGSGVSTTNEAVVETTRQVTGRPIPIAEAPHPSSPADRAFWCADISAAREHLAWTPRHSLAEGLAATYEWMQRGE